MERASVATTARPNRTLMDAWRQEAAGVSICETLVGNGGVGRVGS